MTVCAAMLGKTESRPFRSCMPDIGLPFIAADYEDMVGFGALAKE